MSGFEELEQASPIVQISNGVPTTTSMRVANGTRVQHKNVLELVRDNLADFEEFGTVAFETQPFNTAGGVQRREVAILNEEHATLLLTELPLDGFKAQWAQSQGLTSMPIVVPEGREPWCGYQPELLDGLVS